MNSDLLTVTQSDLPRVIKVHGVTCEAMLNEQKFVTLLCVSVCASHTCFDWSICATPRC